MSTNPVHTSTASSQAIPVAFATNPFAVLGASLRSSKQELLRLAEERALTDDSTLTAKARSELAHPRARVGAEVGWLPGLSPKRASECLALVTQNPQRVFTFENISPLSLANLLSAALSSLTPKAVGSSAAQKLLQLARVVDLIDADQVRRDLNEDRAAAGIPEISATEWVETELGSRRAAFRSSAIAWLDQFESQELVKIVTEAAATATANGENHPYRLIVDVVADFELRAQAAYARAQGLAGELIKAAMQLAAHGESAVKPAVAGIEQLVGDWHKVAKPAQLCAKARGEAHGPSQELFYSVRALAVDLTNEHDFYTLSAHLTQLAGEAFADARLGERATEDANALKGLMEQKAKAEKDVEEWNREITYAASIGWPFKRRLAISPQGLQWGWKRFSLESITRMRWGGVRHSSYGIPTGTTFHIAFGDGRSEAVVRLHSQAINDKFIEKLFKAVGPLLMTRLARVLKEGGTLQFGDIIVHDEWCEVPVKSFLGQKRQKAPWSDLKIWSSNGSFVVGIKADEKAFGSVSYKDGDNAHLIEMMIRTYFKDFSSTRISESLLG